MSIASRISALFCLILVALFLGLQAGAQCLSGTSGLITIPTARMQGDGELSFGASFFGKKYQDYSNRQYDVASAYASITFLPFLEIGLRVNRMLDFPKGRNYTVDRGPMVRLRVLKEGKYTPAVVLGAHDFFAAFGGDGAKHFSATYAVFSKKVAAFDLHAGYAPALMSANHYQLNGLFYGVAYSPLKSVQLQFENDSRYFNTGIRVGFLKFFAVSLATVNFNSLVGGFSFKFKV